MTRDLAERTRVKMVDWFRGYAGWTVEIVQAGYPDNWELRFHREPVAEQRDPTHGLGEHCRKSNA